MKTTTGIFVAVATVLALSAVTAEEASTPARRIREGALAPEFSAVDSAGKPFVFKQSNGKPLLLAFVSPDQERSQEAVEDILRVLSGIPSDRLTSLQVAFVMQDVDNKELIASIQKGAPTVVHVLDDDQYQIWGKFGVIVTPTVLVSDSQGRVLCVKPGHAYDFAPVIRSRLFQALEIRSDATPDNTSAFRIVDNSTASAKARRHLQMAKLMSSKGRAGSAIEQVEMAYEIDPNCLEVRLEFAELLCQAGRAQKAISLVSDVSVQNPREKARINLTLGWANRQLGELENAEKFLKEGIRLDQTSPRLYFELGRIHQERNDTEKAMQAYFQALQLIYRIE